MCRLHFSTKSAAAAFSLWTGQKKRERFNKKKWKGGSGGVAQPLALKGAKANRGREEEEEVSVGGGEEAVSKVWNDSKSNRVKLLWDEQRLDGDAAPVLLRCRFNNPEILATALAAPSKRDTHTNTRTAWMLDVAWETSLHQRGGVNWSHCERRTRQPSLFPVFLEMKLCQRQQCWRDKNTGAVQVQISATAHLLWRCGATNPPGETGSGHSRRGWGVIQSVGRPLAARHANTTCKLWFF